MATTEHGWRRPRPGGITPLYKRLPKGPHGIAPEDVVHHQRIRMHGAMIEAVSIHGYERTSVKHVIGLAGVSRRAFYEQFANKEDCFMETFDLIVNRTFRRVNSACRASDGSLETRARAGLRALVEELETNPKALRLVLIDALMAGPEGQQRLRRAMAAGEQLLASSFHSAIGEGQLPGPLARAAVGGLRRAVFARLREGRFENRSSLSSEMLRWTLLFGSPAVEQLQLRASSKPPLPRVVRIDLGGEGIQSDYERLLESVINLILREPYEELSAPHIAEEAGLSIDTFLDLFETPRDCFMAALDMLGGDLLEAVADQGLVSAQWPLAVCEAIDRLCAHLVERPATAVTLAAKSFGAGMSVIEEMVNLADEVTTLLTEGAPRRAGSRLAPEWISGALAHTLQTEVFAGRSHLLESLSEYLSYVVLAPYIGPEQATQTIVKARRRKDEDMAAAKPSVARPTAVAGGAAAGSAAVAAAAGAPPGRLATPAATAALGEVREDDANERGEDDDDDQRSLA
jgi:AcrR family transcriptional regulator